ncbi:MAG TPA: winged helix-turn-helix domain-containing protein [Pirellulales bacterium]|nr:winged helix-turn-helix domain-containing protein [Pirellulales bacterium]
MSFDLAALEVSIDGASVPLTKTEFGIFEYLDRRKGIICTRRQIIDAVQGEDYPVTERSIDVQMASLRKKLGEIGRRIATIRGQGFRFE